MALINVHSTVSKSKKYHIFSYSFIVGYLSGGMVFYIGKIYYVDVIIISKIKINFKIFNYYLLQYKTAIKIQLIKINVFTIYVT